MSGTADVNLDGIDTTFLPVGTTAMVTALNRTEPYRARWTGRTWEVDGFCVDRPTSVSDVEWPSDRHPVGGTYFTEEESRTLRERFVNMPLAARARGRLPSGTRLTFGDFDAALRKLAADLDEYRHAAAKDSAELVELRTQRDVLRRFLGTGS